VTRDDSQVSVGGMLALSYGLRKKARKKEEKRKSTNCTKGTLTRNGSKWSRKKKRRREVRENDSLEEKIEENRSTQKMDCEQLNKRKKPPMYALEHLAGKTERQASEALKMRVKVDLGFRHLRFRNLGILHLGLGLRLSENHRNV
jgi:adenylosuccinate synthase